MDDEETRLTLIARHLFETCADVARLSGSEAMTVLTAALAIAIAHTKDGWTEEKWDEIRGVAQDYATRVHGDLLTRIGRPN